MNKTIKIIAIVLLVLGALAIIGGVGFGLIGRNLIGRGLAAVNPQNSPQFNGGDRWMMAGRNILGGFRGGRLLGLLGIPLGLVAGGLTLLVAGIVLLVFNKRITAAAEPAATVKEKVAAQSSVTAKEKAPAVKKNGKKKAA
jgi:hypothetical protein